MGKGEWKIAVNNTKGHTNYSTEGRSYVEY